MQIKRKILRTNILCKARLLRQEENFIRMSSGNLGMCARNIIPKCSVGPKTLTDLERKQKHPATKLMLHGPHLKAILCKEFIPAVWQNLKYHQKIHLPQWYLTISQQYLTICLHYQFTSLAYLDSLQKIRAFSPQCELIFWFTSKTMRMVHLSESKT